ncbi:uncharacterized protein LOC133126214 [Conger conger]|uniref:uncharacterized protein LOC133126214 n=1 Tax=Conger conger TaxID=82655 RepID=UPI002A5AE40A|nr:uncharacterized protein LOC133126214 [Conger conger]
MMEETVIHNVITKLLITQSEVALKHLCCLLSTFGSTLDCDEQYLMDGYVHQMEEIITTKQISSHVSRLMQDIVALRKNYWFPLPADSNWNKTQQQ